MLLWFRKTAYETDINQYWNFTMDGKDDGTEAILGGAKWPQALKTLNLSLNQQKLYGVSYNPRSLTTSAKFFGRFVVFYWYTPDTFSEFSFLLLI
jgi:hypothetical protein